MRTLTHNMAEALAASTKDGGKMPATILVADDDLKLLRMLRRTLVYEGFDMVTASDGREALAAIEANHPDALILDWMMPQLDGIRVAERLRALGDDPPS